MIISKTPLRCSFFGGGTDFPEYCHNGKYGYGTVLSTALNMYVYIMVSKRFDDYIRVCYREQEFVKSVDEIQHNIIRESLKQLNIDKGIDIVYSADIPLSSAGVGLASSSALAVGVLNALYAYKGQYVTPAQIAREACKIEIEKIGNPMGIQDQYAVACGGFKQYKFNADDSVTIIEMPGGVKVRKELQKNLLLYYTGITRFSSTILGEQEHKIRNQMERLDHMVEMAEKAKGLLADGCVTEWGNMLDEAWQLKKQYATAVSNPEIDDMYEKAKKAGAIGGKILGAGGGGFMLLFVPEEKQFDVKNAMKAYKLVNFKFEAEGTRIIFSEQNRE